MLVPESPPRHATVSFPGSIRLLLMLPINETTVENTQRYHVHSIGKLSADEPSCLAMFCGIFGKQRTYSEQSRHNGTDYSVSQRPLQAAGLKDLAKINCCYKFDEASMKSRTRLTVATKV